MTRIRTLLAALAVGGMILALDACALGWFDGASRPTVARPCTEVYGVDRCDALLTMSAEALGVDDVDVTAIDIAPEPTPRADGILETRSGSAGIGIIAHVAGGVRETRVCMGVSMEPACRTSPELTIGSPIGNGYEDVACRGEPPDGCETPVPRTEPEARAAARPLRIERIVLPVSGVGRQELRLGEATLPNGILTIARAELGDPWPDGVRVGGEGIRIEVRSLVPGRPAFHNVHEHGWYAGTERVEVFLIVDVRDVDPGATLDIRDVVVG